MSTPTHAEIVAILVAERDNAISSNDQLEGGMQQIAEICGEMNIEGWVVEDLVELVRRQVVYAEQLSESLVRAHDVMLMLNSSDLGRSDREALEAARVHAKAALAQNPNPAGPSGTAEASDYSPEASGAGGAGTMKDELRAAAERMVQAYRDWMAGCDNETRTKDVMAAHIALRDALAKNPAATVIPGTQPAECARYTPGTSGEPTHGGGTLKGDLSIQCTSPSFAVEAAQRVEIGNDKLASPDTDPSFVEWWGRYGHTLRGLSPRVIAFAGWVRDRWLLQSGTKSDAERSALRDEQATAVMPLIGPLIEAWDGTPNDEKPDGLRGHIEAIASAMEGEVLQVGKEVEPGCYIQPVPDHCDRITWRNRYFMLNERQQGAALVESPDLAPLLRRAADALDMEGGADELVSEINAALRTVADTKQGEQA